MNSILISFIFTTSVDSTTRTRKTVFCKKLQSKSKKLCLVSRIFLAHYFFNECRFYCSCFYLLMLLFRVFCWLYHLLFLFVTCIINFRHTKKKKEDSVGVFNHFKNDFIRAYGLAHDAQLFETSTLSGRLNNFDCEFYIRPQIGISEFAETL